MCRSCSHYFNMSVSFLGVVIGFVGFVAFLYLKNVEAGSWALGSGVFAAIVFHLHYLNYSRTLDSWHDANTLQGLQFLGLMVMTVGGATTLWYTFCGVYYNLPMVPVQNSAFITAIWTFMTGTWGLLIIIFGKYFTDVIRRENPPLLAVS